MSAHEFNPTELPWHEEAEHAVLGALLFDNDAWDRCADILLGKHFFAGAHAAIYGAIGGLINCGKPADVITVFEQLRKIGRDEYAGGLPFLNQVAQSVPGSRNVRRHAEIIVEHWMTRALIEQSDEAMSIAKEPGLARDKLERIVSSFGSLERGQIDNVPKSMDKVAVEVIDRINEMHERGEGYRSGLSTFFPGLDDVLGGGFQEGQIIILGGRPGSGKSALALHWGGRHAVNEDNKGLYFSQEMGSMELGQRMLANISGASYSRIKTGRLQDIEWGYISDGTEKLGRSDFHIDEQVGLRLQDIRIKARGQKGVKLIVLDYLQLCAGADEGAMNRNTELETISRGLKQLARQLKCAIVVLSALSRNVDERKHGRAIMKDYKDCGAIEADADVCLSLFQLRPRDAQGITLMGMDVLKNRGGPLGSSHALEFHGDTMNWWQSEFTVAELLKPDRTPKVDL